MYITTFQSEILYGPIQTIFNSVRASINVRQCSKLYHNNWKTALCRLNTKIREQTLDGRTDGHAYKGTDKLRIDF